MNEKNLTRREFIKKGQKYLVGAAVAGVAANLIDCRKSLHAYEFKNKAETSTETAVSIVKIKSDKIYAAVEEAIDLLGGMKEITQNKQRIMLKPNLLSENPRCTTKPEVIQTLAHLMKKAGKEVLIGEGSAAAWRHNIGLFGKIYYTKKQSIIDEMQQYVFDKLGYTKLAGQMDIPLVNLHSGDMVSVNIPDGLVYNKLFLHNSLAEIDMLCSVPMMKTHALAGVTLGMKNLIGLYPGTVYGTVRSLVHSHAADRGSPGVAYETLDMVQANKTGLVVVDGSSAMEGDGPTKGSLVDMNVIVAGTNPLATDMVAANIMGFEPHEIPTFVWAQRIGMKPNNIREIEIRGAQIESVKRKFIRSAVYSWNDIRPYWGAKELK